MPEGHTIHRIALDHERAFGGRRVGVTSPQGRFAAGAARLDGRRLQAVEAYGKHLFYDFGRGELLHVHLGLFGRFSDHGAPLPQPGDNVRLRLANRVAAADLAGATACEIVDPVRREEIVARLGADPLRADADPDLAWERLRRRRGSIGVALMDQSIFAGVGNVYRAEVLAAHGIHPERPAASIGRDEFDGLWHTLVGWLRLALDEQVIITIDPSLVGKARSEVRKGEALHVYRQERCRWCGSQIRRWDLSGRWAYACEVCQPLAREGQERKRVQRPR